MLLPLLLLLATLPQAHAWGLKDFKEEASSPITTDAKYVTLYGSAATLVVLAFEDQIEDPVDRQLSTKKPLGKKWASVGNKIGLGYPNVLYIAGQAVAGAFGNEKGIQRSLGMLKATGYAMSVTQVLKVTVREQRPIEKNQRDSFPSGHSTMAFAFGGFVFEEHGWKWGVPALGVSLLSGISRINDNRHHVHDVLGGATIGLAYGVGMSKLMKKNEKLSFMVAPIVDPQTRGIAFMKDF